MLEIDSPVERCVNGERHLRQYLYVSSFLLDSVAAPTRNICSIKQLCNIYPYIIIFPKTVYPVWQIIHADQFYFQIMYCVYGGLVALLFSLVSWLRSIWKLNPLLLIICIS